MKRNFLKLMMLAILPLAVVSCIDNVPEEEVLPRDAVSFDYYIDQETEPKYYLDYYVDSDVTFINTSPATTSGTPTWDFGDGTVLEGDTVVHSFTKAGTYTVQLSMGDYSKKQVLMISAIKPLLTLVYPEGTDFCEVRKTLINFQLELPNPKNKPATFKWTFPKDTKTATDAEYATYEADDVNDLPEAVKFWHVGSQEVKLEVILGGETLETVIKNVQVGYDKEVPTLYYAVQGGRIMAYKLTQGTGKPANMQVSPFDMGIASGQHPFTLLFKDTLLYVLDAGKQFYYVDDTDGVLGDGKISVIAKDGSKVQTMISNTGQAAFDDPFYGCIDGDNLCYANRNTGIIKVPLKDRDKMYNITDYPYYVNHNTLGYYNNGMAYGAIGGTIAKIDGIWYWAKFYNANGIFRFKDGPTPDGDILPSAIGAGDDSNKPKSGILIPGTQAKSFVYATKSQKLCFHVMDADCNGFYCATIAELEALMGDKMSKNTLKNYKKTFNGMDFVSNTSGNLPAVEGTGSESVGICQMAYDEKNDCVYFGFRNNSTQKDLYPATGIYRYNLATDQIDCLIQGPSVYGLAVNNAPSKLF